MGSWGAGSFENDAAMDWLEVFTNDPTAKTLVDAINDASGENEQEVVAAAELVARLCGRPSAELVALQESEELPTVGVPAAERDRIRLAALTAVERVSGASELRKLWNESEDAGREWQQRMDSLRERLARS